MKYKAISENHLYVKAYTKGRFVRTDRVVVYTLPDRHAFLLRKQNPLKQSINRIGITVSKKIGIAVVRTRARRVIREAYRQLDVKYGIKKGFLVVLVAREKTPLSKTGEVMQDMEFAFRKLGMIK